MDAPQTPMNDNLTLDACLFGKPYRQLYCGMPTGLGAQNQTCFPIARCVVFDVRAKPKVMFITIVDKNPNAPID